MEKTCGNCGHTISVPVESEDGTMQDNMIGVCPYDWAVDFLRNEPSFIGHLPEKEPCEEWIEQKEPSLEQRYQQLSEVARSLYELGSSLMDQVSEVGCQEDLTKRLGAALGSVTGAGHVLNRAAEQLEELGVKV